MKISFNKNIAVYIFGGLAICVFATLFFIYSQLRDVDNFKSMVVEKIGKGIVKIEEDPEHPAVIHGVQHVFHPPTWLDHWPSSDRRSRLVFIAKTIQPTWVNALIETLDAEVRQLNNSQPNKGAIGR